jgi:hypothetical protein
MWSAVWLGKGCAEGGVKDFSLAAYWSIETMGGTKQKHEWKHHRQQPD